MNLNVLFAQQWFLSLDSPMNAVFAHSLLRVKPLTLILTEASETRSSLDVVKESLVPLLGTFTTFPRSLYLGIMALTVVHWSPQGWVPNLVLS